MKVTYFDLKARAEPTRLALHIAGVAFEDERIDFDDFPRLRSSLPFCALPTLTIDGEVYAESNAMLRFAGKQGGDLYPKCDKAALKVDMIVDVMETVMEQIFRDKTPEGRAKFVAETLPRYVGAVDKIYAKSAGPYLLGDTVSIADIKLYCVLDGMNEGKQYDHVPAGVLDQFSHVMTARKAVAEHEKVKDWYASRA